MLLSKKNNDDKTQKPKKKAYIPSAFLIIFGLMLVFIIVSWIGKAVGASTQIWDEDTGSFITADIQGLGFLDTLTAVWQGFSEKVDVILFILAVGGMLGIMTKTKAIDAGIDRVVEKLNGKEIYLIPILMFLFGLGGTSYGMWEETIAFFPVLIPIFIKAGYGPLTAVMVILLGAGSGCLASTVNPFAVSVAFDGANQAANGASEVSQSVGMGSRWLSFVIFEAIAIIFVVFLAKKIKSGKIVVSGIDNDKIEKKFPQTTEKIDYTWRRKFAMITFISGFLLMILSFLPWSSMIGDDALATTNANAANGAFWIASTAGGWAAWGEWYFISVAAVFFLISLLVFAFNRNDFVSKDENKEKVFIKTFMDGASDVLSVCLLIAVAGGLGFLLNTSNIGPWMANSMKGIGDAGLIGFGILMFLVAMILSFVMPSTSGFAAAFMPIFGGIAFKAFPNQADQAIAITVMAFIFASGIVNLITPTSSALMAYTAYSEIPYNVWIKRIWPIIPIFIGVAIVLLASFGAMADAGSLF